MLTLQVLDNELEKRVAPTRLRLNEDLDRRMHGPITPNEQLAVTYRSKLSYERTILLLAVASWYLEDLGWLLRANLKDFNLRRISPENRGRVELALSSKVAALELVSRFHERDIFGNLLPQLEKLAEELRLKSRKPKRARRKVFRRGYRDHGTLRPAHRWRESSDWSFDQLQNIIEEERQTYKDTLELLRGFLE